MYAVNHQSPFHNEIITQGRRQSKTLLTIDKRESKIDRNRVFGCHLSPTGDKWQLKTLFLEIFDPLSSIAKSVLDCRIPGVIMPIDILREINT